MSRHDGGDGHAHRGVRKRTKRARQYEHIKDSERASGASESRAEEIAARTVNTSVRVVENRAGTRAAPALSLRGARKLLVHADGGAVRRGSDLHRIAELAYEPETATGVLIR